MELDELKASWQRLDHRVQELTLINRRLMLDNTVRKARWRLAPLIAGAVANVVLGVFFAIGSANYLISHLDFPPALVAGIAVFAVSVLFIVFGVGRLTLAWQIDFRRPVVEIQRTLALMQKWEAWSFHAAWMGISLLMPALMVAFAMVIAGSEVWDWSRARGYLLLNLVLWLAVALTPPLLYVFSRRNGRLAARIDAFLEVHSITRAKAAIDEIDEFSR